MIEVPAFEDILSNNRTYALIPEHVNYFTLPTLTNLVGQYFTVLESAIGFSDQFLYVIFRNNLRTPKDFVKQHHRSISALEKFLRTFKNKKVVMWGYGTKGKMLLNLSAGLARSLHLIVDSDRSKWGMVKHAAEIKITSPSALKSERPDVVIISAITYYDAIIRDLKKLRWRGQLLVLDRELTVEDFPG